MRNRNLFFIAMIALAIGTFFASCKSKDNPPPAITGEALFSVTTDGQTATFTNESTVSGVVTYAWDFGDGETSTEKDPVHTYATKGEYTVTLTVTDAQGGTHPVSTKVKVDKATRISLTDGTFSDWDAVTEANLVVKFNDTVPNVVKAAKFDFDANMVYVYMKFDAVDSVYFDIMMDNDNDTATGARSWLWPLMGTEYLIEGQMAVAGAELTSFYFNGATPDAWAWGDDKPFTTGYYTIGTVTNVGGVVTIEFGLARDKVTGLDNNVVKWGIFLSDPVSWADIGYVPDQGGDGFTIDMN